MFLLLAVVSSKISQISSWRRCSANTPPPEQSSTSVAPSVHGGFAHCLSEHGVPAAPGPAAGPPPGVDQDTWQRAMEACSALAPGPAG